MRQDGPKKDLKSLKVPKSSNCKKCDFAKGKPYFLSLGGSQDEHKRLKTALKRHLKCFKTRKIRVPKLIVFFYFWDQFWSRFGAQNGPPKFTENQSKSDQKLDCIKRTEIEVEKRNVEGLSFGLKLESLCTNKRKGFKAL